MVLHIMVRSIWRRQAYEKREGNPGFQKKTKTNKTKEKAGMGNIYMSLFPIRRIIINVSSLSTAVKSICTVQERLTVPVAQYG